MRKNRYSRNEHGIEEDKQKQKESDVKEHKQKEEEEVKKEAYQSEKEKWLKKRGEYMERAAKFSELKKKRLNEKKKIEDSKKKIFEDEDIWAELDNIIKENELALKGLEDYKIIVEMKEKEEDMKLRLEEELRIGIEDSSNKENNKDDEDDELRKTLKRIRELEFSISSLDHELERFEIEKMNIKTEEVKKRMSLVTGDSENVLNPAIVDSFINKGNSWGKYMISAK